MAVEGPDPVENTYFFVHFESFAPHSYLKFADQGLAELIPIDVSSVLLYSVYAYVRNRLRKLYRKKKRETNYSTDD